MLIVGLSFTGTFYLIRKLLKKEVAKIDELEQQ